MISTSFDWISLAKVDIAKGYKSNKVDTVTRRSLKNKRECKLTRSIKFVCVYVPKFQLKKK